MTVTYWRERNFEVDFVLRHGGSVIGVEVKSGRNKGSLAGLERFTRDFDTRPGPVWWSARWAFPCRSFSNDRQRNGSLPNAHGNESHPQRMKHAKNKIDGPHSPALARARVTACPLRSTVIPRSGCVVSR